MSARPALRAAPIVAALLVALTACSGPAASPTSSAPSEATKPATTASTASAAASGGSAAGGGSGSITLTGTFSGAVTIESCDGNTAILNVHYDGHSPDSSGSMDSRLHLFGINGPNSEQFIPSPLSQKVTVSGKTFTVKDFRLAQGNEVLTANGSVTCP